MIVNMNKITLKELKSLIHTKMRKCIIDLQDITDLENCFKEEIIKKPKFEIKINKKIIYSQPFSNIKKWTRILSNEYKEPFESKLN